jgi:SAM-dependent methyltransferase
MLSPQEDAYGQCMYKHFRGGHPAEVVERDDGHVQSNGKITATYFAEFKDWPTHQRQAIRFVRGRVLDIGCGAGRVGLHLQSRGHDVVSVDSSPLAVKVCRLRGVKNAKVLSVTQITSRLGQFDTLVMFGTNFGLFANPRRAGWLLKRFHTMTSPQARIIAETLNPYERATPPGHRKYCRLNRQRGRMPGQLRVRVRYGFACTPWFDHLIVSQREMRSIVRGTGWRVTQILNSKDPGYKGIYVAIIEKEK